MITLKFTADTYENLLLEMARFGVSAAGAPNTDATVVVHLDVEHPKKERVILGGAKLGRPKKRAENLAENAPVTLSGLSGVLPGMQRAMLPEGPPTPPSFPSQITPDPVTLEDVRAALHAFVDRQGGLADLTAQDAGRKLLLTFGASKTSELAPGQYVAFVGAANAA